MTMPHLSNCEHQPEGWCLDCVGKLHAELEAEQAATEAMRRDAERYRWLRKRYENGSPIYRCEQEFDAAIDAGLAAAKEREHG